MAHTQFLGVVRHVELDCEGDISEESCGSYYVENFKALWNGIDVTAALSEWQVLKLQDQMIADYRPSFDFNKKFKAF